MTDTPGARSLLELTGITKRFGDLVANDAVDLRVGAGEVVSMLGENGAGKSTLMKITYGLVRADSGTVQVGGKDLDLRSPKDAMAAGIGMVTQEFSLVPTMSVAENVALSGVRLGRVDTRNLRESVLAVMDRVGVHLPPEQLVGSLSIGERQRVEIIKALYHDCKVLILDEPTAVLTPQDVEALFGTIRRLRESGIGVLFVSHKLREVAEISDRVVVLRHGKMVADRPMGDVDIHTLAGLMMGVTAGSTTERPAVSAAIGLGVESTAAAQPSAEGQEATITDAAPVLDIRGLGLADNGAQVLTDIDLAIRPGEILGIAGISGNGQSQLVDVLAGVRASSSGTITVDGRDITRATVDQRLRAGLGRLTEDRRGTSFAAMSVEQNLVIEDLATFRRYGILDRAAIRRHTDDLIERFAIKAKPTDPVGSLSGGNVQKVLLARALARDPRVLIAAQPTRGLDIGTCAYVHEQLRDLRARGAGVLLISEDLDELRSLCDRIAVIFRGRIVGLVPVADANAERLGIMMTGGEGEAA